MSTTQTEQELDRIEEHIASSHKEHVRILQQSLERLRDLCHALEARAIKAEEYNKDWAMSLNRRVEVEQVLYNVAIGKVDQSVLTKEKCKFLADKLSIPTEWLALQEQRRTTNNGDTNPRRD